MEISASSANTTEFYAVIVAGGSGTRLGGALPKQYEVLGGQTMLAHTIHAFQQCAGLQKLCVVIGEDHQELFDSIRCVDMDCVIGGKSRNESVFNGIRHFSNLSDKDIILIHDAARPFVTPSQIAHIAADAQKHKAATLAVRVVDTLKYENGSYVNRDNLWNIQTPQGFHYGLLKQAHEQASPDHGWTDDTAMVEALGHKITFVESTADNFKVTTAQDLEKARNIMKNQTILQTRTGSGFDVHAFDTMVTDAIRLSGIDIPFDKKLKGHSDADVALHTITDALLGAMGEGDIGLHFPPSEAQWKDKDSAVFLEHAVDILRKKEGQIVNIDLTIICEAPKLGTYRDIMRERIAAICSVDKKRINVKGTTTEKLGFVGRGEGIAAQAVATILLPQEA